MSTITAQVIVDAAEKTLLDETNVRWGEAELLGYLNDGQRHIVMLKPDAYAKHATVAMTVSETLNSIPSDGIRLIRPVRNMGTNGTTRGRVITWADMDELDNTNPNWHLATAAAEVLHFLQDPSDPKKFFVFPPQPGSNPGYAEFIYSAAPPDVAIGSTISLDDIYKDPIYFYIMSRAHSKETPAAKAERATTYYNLFLQSIGLKTTAERSVDKVPPAR